MPSDKKIKYILFNGRSCSLANALTFPRARSGLDVRLLWQVMVSNSHYFVFETNWTENCKFRHGWWNLIYKTNNRYYSWFSSIQGCFCLDDKWCDLVISTKTQETSVLTIGYSAYSWRAYIQKKFCTVVLLMVVKTVLLPYDAQSFLNFNETMRNPIQCRKLLFVLEQDAIAISW